MKSAGQFTLLVTRSKTTGDNCYYDGHGFTLSRDNARLYLRQQAEELKPILEDSYRHVLWIETAAA